MKFTDIASLQNRVGGEKMPFGSKFTKFKAFMQMPVIQADAIFRASCSKIRGNKTYHLVDQNLSLW